MFSGGMAKASRKIALAGLPSPPSASEFSRVVMKVSSAPVVGVVDCSQLLQGVGFWSEYVMVLVFFRAVWSSSSCDIPMQIGCRIQVASGILDHDGTIWEVGGCVGFVWFIGGACLLCGGCAVHYG